MRRYDDGEFIENEPNRRKLRDQYRDKFFEELGIPRLKDPFAHDPDPAAQLALVQNLIGKALSIHGGDKAGLEMAKVLVASSALGVPLAGLGASAAGRPDFQASTIERMFESTFDRWFGSAKYHAADDGAA
jgi:hypothetical protein